MKNEPKYQALTADDLNSLEKEIQTIKRDKLMLEKNIAIKEQSGYFEAVAQNAAIDRWRETDRAGYAKQRRKSREAEAEKEGRILRAYEPATPERRQTQWKVSKAKERLDPEHAAAEQVKNTAAKKAKRDEMTQAERDEANRIRREKRAAKKLAP